MPVADCEVDMVDMVDMVPPPRPRRDADAPPTNRGPWAGARRPKDPCIVGGARSGACFAPLQRRLSSSSTATCG